MEGWSKPLHRKFKITYKNLYGVEVVSFVYGVSMQYGGTYNGTGSYVLGANIYQLILTYFGDGTLMLLAKTVAFTNTGTLLQ